jgi:murein L,D-transpeptidase YcbB/YkuD
VATVSVDQPVADALRELITTRLSRISDRKAERAAIEAFYSGRSYQPIWISDGAASKRATAAIARMQAASEDGLDSADYPIPAIKAGAEPAALADAELRLTLSALTYARHAQSGRVHFTRIGADILYPANNVDPAEVLGKLASADDAGAALWSYQPPHAAYKALRAKLADIRQKGESGPAKIPGGPVLTMGKTKKGQFVLMQDERVPALRARLGLEAVPGDEFYDKPLMDAVAAYQKSKGLKPNGQLTAATIDALNGRRSKDRDIEIIISNLERWRWVPRELGRAHVILNIPDFTLQVYREGTSIWKTRVVVGKPGNHATPLLTETMKYITVNPTWNVPPSIVYGEYLPALQQDPTVLDRMGLKLSRRADGSVHISQPPGAGNALGRIRFNFPNKFLVYQHDTPDKHLFGHEKRAYSHGCMRVQNPAKYAEVLLGLTLPGQNYTEQRITSMFGSSEIDIKFPTPIPVHIMYQTAFVDEHGNLQFRDDVYGRDQRTLTALKNEDRKVADLAIETRQPSVARPRVPDNFGPSGPSFFERLFGVSPTPAPAQPRPRRSVSR